jgi:hypothetical protein
MNGSGESQGCTHICPGGHELRVTRRALEEDLGEDPEDYEFDGLCTRYPIVHAFREKRTDSTAGSDTVGPKAGEWTITTLRHTNDHRGATWYDPKTGVVWLLAAAHHRSGEPDDAFPYFIQLLDGERIYPVEKDLEELFSERKEQFAVRAKLAAPALLAEAQASPETEVTIEIGAEPVSCFVYVVETAEERYFAVSGHVGVIGLEVLKALFAPEQESDAWRSEGSLPTRNLDYSRSEMCFSIVTG